MGKTIKIALYISDHGLGHAMRDVALVRALLNLDEPRIKVRIRTRGPFVSVLEAFTNNNGTKDPRIDFIKGWNDFGFIQDEKGWKIDKKKTIAEYYEWIQSWEAYIDEEVTDLTQWQPDMLISDIACQPFLIAEKLEIPSVGFSNFSWLDNYKVMFQEEDVDLEPVYQAYQAGDAVLSLPFTLSLDGFRRVIPLGLVCKKPTLNREYVRKKLNIGSNLLAVSYLGRQTRKSYKLKIDIPTSVYWWDFGSSNRTRLVNPPDLNLNEAQNIVGASDLFLGKPGYGIIAEAVYSKIPMFLVPTPGFPEGIQISQEIEDAGIGIILENGQFSEREFNELETLSHNFAEIPERLAKDGTKQAIDYILNVTS